MGPDIRCAVNSVSKEFPLHVGVMPSAEYEHISLYHLHLFFVPSIRLCKRETEEFHFMIFCTVLGHSCQNHDVT